MKNSKMQLKCMKNAKTKTEHKRNSRKLQTAIKASMRLGCGGYETPMVLGETSNGRNSRHGCPIRAFFEFSES